MKTFQGAVCTLLFFLSLQCCQAALRGGSSSLPASDTQVSLASGHSENPNNKAVAGRHKLSYLVALQSWSKVTRTGVECPKPQACECHCDCPNTVATGVTPTSPPLCPVFPAFPIMPTPAPPKKIESKVYDVTPAPVLKAVKCEEGEVALSDGTCKFIDMKVIQALLKLVEAKKAILVKAQHTYNSHHQPKCTSCPGAAAYFDTRLKLIDAHQQYQAALGLFLNALGWMKTRSKELGETFPPKDQGPEFVLGEKRLRSHCEPWTVNHVNGTQEPTDALCAVVCRNQVSCVGFARDPENKWCVWFDDEKPESRDVCSAQMETKYIKKWQGKVNNELWTSMQKLQVFDKAIVEALKLADGTADKTNKTFVNWWGFDDGQNHTVKLNLEETFLVNMDDYTGALLDTAAIRKQYVILQVAADDLLRREAIVNPGVDAPAPVVRVKAKKIKPIEGFKAPLEAEPAFLKWKDFPNSEDTAWSAIHPDCPMGTPCFCDCKCRGAPPQNFVEPPPPPAIPCPLPPPLPNPAVLSAILR